MINRFAFEAVEQTIRNLVKNTPYCSEDRIFGGMIFVLGGDFREILPIVTKSGRELTVSSSLPRSSIWGHYQERCILTPRNDDVDDLNSKILSLILGESQVFLSADTLTPIENGNTSENMNSAELLHSLNFPGIPNHRLELQVGAPIILLRNLNQ